MLKRFIWLFIALVSTCLISATYWVYRPLPLVSETVDLSIEPQTTVRGIAKAAVSAGIEVNAQVLLVFLKLSGESRALRAGSYEITNGESAFDLLRKLSRGQESLKAISLIDGWTFRQFRVALAKAEGLKHDTKDLSDDALMTQLGLPGVAPEGRFFPDTYTYGKGTSELHVMQRAANAMTKQLAAAWGQRHTDIQIKTIDEALILASIIEKETGRESDRTTISRVFHNRLAIGMPLQTDPTVIYGMFDNFDGNLRRADLRTDQPWNTYTRKGLPPTPIAMPGRNALKAAVQPAPSNALYFVAKGDGTSQFSATLEEHNSAVNRYQRRASGAAAGAGQ